MTKNTLQPVRSSGFQPQIQAMRAVAILLVLGYHFFPSKITGGYVGVDVFLVISGFLISSHLIRELDRTSSIELKNFWAKRIRRLLPASLVTLSVVLLATMVFAPEVYRMPFLQQIIASALYVENWYLAASSVDYSALAVDASPVQHFWSLSLEEQFYVMLPIALLLLAISMRRKVSWGALVVFFSSIAVASFLFGLFYTSADPARAYFNTFGRIWEFGIGALVGLFLPRFGALGQTGSSQCTV